MANKSEPNLYIKVEDLDWDEHDATGSAVITPIEGAVIYTEPFRVGYHKPLEKRIEESNLDLEVWLADDEINVRCSYWVDGDLVQESHKEPMPTRD